MDRKYTILKEYFGHSGFREGQEGIVDSLLSGRDVLGIMPTGAGKSVCYQVPALILPGITIVVSPLISLMTDQVMALVQAGVPAAYFNSSLTSGQYAKALRNAAEGRYKIIYVAPERLLTTPFMRLCETVKISMVAVDEAHCVSQWGQDFRPSYRKIAEFLSFFRVRPVVGAFTATATQEVKADIRNLLQLRNPYEITTGFDRPNLFFSVQRPESKEARLLRLLRERPGRSGIIYCSTRKTVEEICDMLNREGYPVTRYHGGLEEAERRINQEDFVYDRKPIMVATNAFGMGIDKSDVSFVIHYQMPMNLESYYQEAGRAGRDGSPADCILLYGPRDVRLNRYLMENSEGNPELTEAEQALVRRRDEERLKYMTYYSTTKDCLRRFLLNYFGERPGHFCGNCSNCLPAPYHQDRWEKTAGNAGRMYGKNQSEGRMVSRTSVGAAAPRSGGASASDLLLMDALKDLRKRLAVRAMVPVYTVFSDATLTEMCRKRPQTPEEFLEISGVGKIKLKQYGELFLEVIRNFES